MKNVVVSTIYGSMYTKDRFFDLDACAIGHNLLLPNVVLRDYWKSIGIEYHTADLVKVKDVSVYLFLEVPQDSWLTTDSLLQRIKYILKFKWRSDYLLKSVLKKDKVRRYLIVNEPKVVSPKSHDVKYHCYFDKIFTWDDDVVDSKRYIKLYPANILPKERYCADFSIKKKITLIASNKHSSEMNELYSERRKAIDFYDGRAEFDLYGFGWEGENLKSYRGTVDDKLSTLSKYRFCICYENNYGTNGYITEKLFDCFFANCVPIYWGADNVLDYIPENTFIDRRNFSSMRELDDFIEGIDEKQFDEYIANIQSFLNGEKFQKFFSVDAYVKTLTDVIGG